MTNNPVQIPPTPITPITWKTRLILLRQKLSTVITSRHLSPLSLIIGVLSLVIALQIIFGLNYLNQRFGFFHTPTWLANLLTPKIEYTFESAGRTTGYTIINQNRANGFAMLLSKANQPNVPSGQFTVADSNISFSLKNTINFSSFVKTTENGRDFITWQNTLPDTDVVYSVVPDGLKEDIILKNSSVAATALREKIRYQIAYDLTTTNVKPRPGLDGRVTPAFFDIRTGEYRFHIAPLTMVDADGVRYEALKYVLKPITGIASEKGGFIKSVAQNLFIPIYAQNTSPVTTNYQLIIDLPRDWLADPSRAYPVIIDPTITHNTKTLFATGYLDRVVDVGAAGSGGNVVAQTSDANTRGLWNLDEASGNALDSSGNSNTMTANGMSVVSGKFSNARSLNGTSSDYLTCTDADCGGTAKLDIGSSNWSISAWIKTTNINRQAIVSKGTANGEYSYELETGDTNDGKPRFYLYNTTNFAYMQAIGTYPVNDGNWHHIAGTYDGTTISLYVDGVLDASSTTKSGTQVTDTPGNFSIGARTDAGTQYFNGQIDDVKVSNVARTAAEIAVDALGTVENNPLLTSKYHELPADANTIALWHMNEASGNISDSSDNGYTGTVTGTTVVAGVNGNARSFTGGDDISLGNQSMIDTLADITIEAWLYPTAQTAATLYRAFDEHVVLVAGMYGNQVAFYVGNGVDTWVTADTTGGALPINQWSHVAWVKNATNYYIYINGNLTKTGTVQARLATSTYVNYISTYDGTNQPWTGRIDELRISDIARTPEEIKADAQRYPYATYTSPVLDLTRALSWTDLTWTAKGIRPVALQDGETPISTTGLIAQWNFNETSGTAAVSGGSCGTTCNGTLTTFASTGSQDATPLSGWTANNRRWGAGAIMFDNSDDYVITTYDAAQNPTGSAITVEAWVNSRGLAALDRIVGTANANTGYRLRLSSASANDLDFYIGNGAAYRSCIKPHFMIPGSWYHLAATYDGATFNLYVNGRNIGSCADVFTPSWGTTAIAIGGAPEYWNGTIDSTRIYSRVLTASEILANYSAGQIEFQTRTGTDSTPNDGGWESWLPTSNETQIAALDAVGLTNWANTLLVRNATALPSGDILSFVTVTSPAVGSNSYHKTIAGAGTVLATNDTIEYDVYLVDNLPGAGNIDAVFTDGTLLKSFVACHNTDLAASAYAKWYHRSCTIPAGANSKVIDWIDLVTDGIPENETETAGTAYYDNLVVKNSSGAIKATLYTSGTPLYNQLHSETDAANTQVLTVTKNVNNTLSIDTSAKIEGTGSNRINLVAASPNQLETFNYSGGNTEGWIEIDPNNSIDFLNRKLTLNSITAAWNKAIISRQGWTRVADRYFYGKVTTGAATNNRMALGWFANATTGDDTDLTHGLKFDEGVLSVIENGAYYHTGAPVALTAEASTIGLWHFDETANDTCSGGEDACDSSTNANHGTATGTTILDAQLSKGRSFTGADDISIGNKSIVDSLANLTVEAWVYPTAQTAGTNFRIFSEESVLFVGQYGNQVSVYMGNGAAWTAPQDITGGTLPINQWSHVAWVKSGTSYFIYINGVLTKTAATAPATLGTSANVNYISTSNGTVQPWTGRLDELRISNVALTQAQIQADLGSSLYATDTSYETKITLKSTGADYAIKGGAYSNWTTIYNGVGSSLTTTPMRIAVAHNNFLGSVDELAVQNDAATQLFRETFARRQPWIEITDNGSINFWDDKIVLSNVTQAWDKALISKNSFSRVAGKYLYGKFTTLSSVATPNHVMVGWFANAETGTYTSLTHGIYFAAGGLSVYENGGAYAANGPATTYTANTAYEFRITLKATGADYEIKGGAYANWTIIYNGTGANLTTTPMRVAITQYNATGYITELSVYDASGDLEFQDTFKGKQAWVEIDTNNSIDLLDNTVKLNTVSAAWNYGLISKNSYSRLPGRYLYGKYTTGASVTPSLNAMVGWAANTDAVASYTNINHALYLNSGTFGVYENSSPYTANGPATTYTTNTTYEFRITLKSIGAIYEVKGGAYTDWTLVYDGPGGGLSNEPMRVQISQNSSTGSMSEVSVYDPLPTVSTFSQTISSTDLSAKSKLAIWAASDRPGTFISAMFGEGAFANYELNGIGALGFWRLEEKGTQDGSLIDSSGNGKNLALTGTSLARGKIGGARTFNGTADYLCSDSNGNGVCDDDLDNLTTGITVGAWVSFVSATGVRPIIDKIDTSTGYTLGLNLTTNGCVTANLCFAIGDGSNRATNFPFVPALNTWYHIVGIYDGAASTISLYINGQLVSSAATSTSAVGNSTQAFCIGGLSSATTCATSFFSGTLDEIFVFPSAITNLAIIRQMFEYGSRLHNITFDFVTTPQAAYSSGTSATINNPSGTTNLTDTLSVGDTIIFEETVSGVETIGQATVTAITNTSAVYGTVTLATAPSFPAGGYTTAAKVFKWQKEYLDVTGTTLATDRDAVTRLTYRVYNNSQDTNIWLDDLRSNSNYINLNTPTSFDIASGIGTHTLSGASITSALNRYFQYRSIFSTTDTQTSPSLASTVLNYFQNTLPNAPVISTPANGATDVQFRPAFTVSTTDIENDYLQYKFELATDSNFASIVMTANQNTSQTGWSGQNAASSTAYNSGSTATFTMQSDLTAGVTYYLRATALDPVGGNIFSNPSATISFTVINLTIPVANPATNVHQTTFTANWSAVAAATSYRLDVSTATDFSSYVTGYENKTIATTSEILTNIPLATGQTYYYRVRAKSALDTSANSNTVTVRLGLCSAPISGSFSITSSCRFSANIDGVEQGDMTIVAGNTLTINAGQTIAWNAAKKITIQTGAHIAIADGGQVKQTNLWMQDVDADQYASSLTQAAANNAPNANYKRRHTMKTYLFTDQDDTLPEGYHSRPILDAADGLTSWTSSDLDAAPLSTESADKLKGTGSILVGMQPPTFGAATDGACSVTSGSKNLNTQSCSDRATADAANFSVTSNTAVGQTQITLASTPTGLALNDEILIINLVGPNAGTYETARISLISGNTLTLNKVLLNGYDGTTNKIMVQRIPNYTNVTIDAGTTLTTSALSCTTFRGGVIFIRASGDVTVNGTISTSNLGFPGGGGGYPGAREARGRNPSSCSLTAATSQLNGGGGGGSDDDSTNPYDGGGGGGAGYGTAGTNGTAGGAGNTLGSGGSTYGVANLTSLFLGAAGGVGAGDQGTPYGGTQGGGGYGGGAIAIFANTITVNAATGLIVANGSNGEIGTYYTDPGYPGVVETGGGGGGGTGGSILLKAPTTSLGTNRVTATGGTGSTGGVYGGGTSGNGGAAGVGRIRCDNTGGNCATTSPASNNNVISIINPNTDITIRRMLDAPLDLSLYGHISIWVKSSTAGVNILQFGMGEAAATEQTFNITINDASTWEEKVFDISAISATSRDAIRHLHLKNLGTTYTTFLFNAFTYYE